MFCTQLRWNQRNNSQQLVKAHPNNVLHSSSYMVTQGLGTSRTYGNLYVKNLICLTSPRTCLRFFIFNFCLLHCARTGPGYIYFPCSTGSYDIYNFYMYQKVFVLFSCSSIMQMNCQGVEHTNSRYVRLTPCYSICYYQKPLI